MKILKNRIKNLNKLVDMKEVEIKYSNVKRKLYIWVICIIGKYEGKEIIK